MVISDFAIEKPIVTVTVMIALVVFGLFALISLNTDEFPDVQPPVIAVTIVYPGASPQTVEREIVDRVEEAVFSISGVDGGKTTSSATDGLASFVISFEFGKDINQASQDIRDAISRIRQDLPPDMKEPVLQRFDPAEQPIVQLNLTSPTLSAAELTRIADPGVVRELRGVSGVAQANVVGAVTPEMTVQLDPALLEASNISVAQVVQAIEAQNLAAPVGRLNTTFTERSIRLKGRMENARDFEQLVVAEQNGQTVRLGQLGRVFAGSEEPRTLALYNGEQAVGIDILKSKGFSTTQVASAVLKRVTELEKTLPQGASLRTVVNAGDRVTRSVRDVEETLFVGALLTVLVVFLFLNSWRSTVITGLALPVSVLASFISVWAFGFTLNTMSLLGLSLAIGILIDDAIVVRENIVRHVELGRDHYLAAKEGTDEIGLAVAATTFSIVSVFVPIAFISGLAGQWFKPFALTIACAVLASLFVSFSLDPMLSAYWPDPQLEEGQRRGAISRALTRFNQWFERVAHWYEGVIGWALDHRFGMVAIAAGSLVLALFLQATLGGVEFAPLSDRSEVYMLVETPPGSSLDYTRQKIVEIDALLRSHPEVQYTSTNIGTPLPLRAPGVDQAQVYARLVPKARRRISENDLGIVLRSELARVAGADTSVFTTGFGGAIKQIQIEIRGPDIERLEQIAEQYLAVVKTVPGAVDAGLSTRGRVPEVEIAPRRGLAGALGVTVAQVAQSLLPAFQGLDSGDWVDPTGQTRDVVVRLAPEARQRPADLARLPITIGPPGQQAVVPLNQLADITEGVAPAEISHLNRDRVIDVQANVEGHPLSEVVGNINQKAAGIAIPPGYRVSQGGEARDTAEVFTAILEALGLAVMLMYLILVVQFSSFIDPIAILVSLPLSLIGVVLMLLLLKTHLNIMSMIGVILLFGIVTKNAILLVDFAKWERERGATLREALIRAGRIRFRPILMTTFAIIAGMIPVALGWGEGADFRAPLGRAVIGGVITSTILTLLVIPTVYEILDAMRTRAMRLFRRGKKGGEARHPPPGQGSEA